MGWLLWAARGDLGRGFPISKHLCVRPPTYWKRTPYNVPWHPYTLLNTPGRGTPHPPDLTVVRSPVLVDVLVDNKLAHFGVPFVAAREGDLGLDPPVTRSVEEAGDTNVFNEPIYSTT